MPWNGKDLGATLKRASEVAGGNLGNGGAAAGDVGAPPVITSVLVRQTTRSSFRVVLCASLCCRMLVAVNSSTYAKPVLSRINAKYIHDTPRTDHGLDNLYPIDSLQ